MQCATVILSRIRTRLVKNKTPFLLLRKFLGFFSRGVYTDFSLDLSNYSDTSVTAEAIGQAAISFSGQGLRPALSQRRWIKTRKYGECRDGESSVRTKSKTFGNWPGAIAWRFTACGFRFESGLTVSAPLSSV